MNDVELKKGSFFYNLVFWGRKLQAGFIAFVLFLATVFIYQYLRDTNQPPLILVAKVQTDVAVFTLNVPEGLFSKSNGIASDIKLTTNSLGKEISDAEGVVIDFSSDNPNINFEPKQITLSKLELEKEENSYVVKLLSASSLRGQRVGVKIGITNANGSQVFLEKAIPVDNKINNPYVITLAFLSFVSAILSFIMQVRSFRSK